MNKKSTRLLSFILTFLIIFSIFDFGIFNEKVLAKDKEISTQASIDPRQVEVSPGESFKINITSEKGNYLAYKSKIPGMKYGKMRIGEGMKITIPKDTMLGSYELTDIEIYDVNERALLAFPEALRSQKIDQQIKFKTDKVCDLPNVKIIVKHKNEDTNVHNIILNKQSLELREGENFKLIATVLPENATNKEVIWTSSDDSIVKISNEGDITAFKTGEATIKVGTVNGKNLNECKIVVKPKEETKVDEENKASSHIEVRVEGVNNTLFHKNIPVKDEVYVKDLISNALGEENIEGLDSNFIESIFKEKKTASSGWMYYLVDNNGDVLQGDSINIQKIKNVNGNYYKEMVWYMAKWVGGITNVPKINIECTGNNYKFRITEQNAMFGIEPKPSKDVNVKVEGIGEYKTDEKGEVSFKVTGGEHKVHIYKNSKDSGREEYSAIVRQSFIIMGETSEEENKLEDIIKDIKKYYEDNDNESYLNVLSFNHINFGEKKEFKLQNSNNAAAIADNIMGIIAIGKNPYSYKGINYVKQLTDSQKEDGKFIIGRNDKNSITAQSETIIALDMASAKYDVDKALKALISSVEDGKHEDIDSTTKVLIALSKHKDVKGVVDLINFCLNNLKEKQLEGGGFDYLELGNSPYSTASAIQALVAVGEDPLSEKWSKGGKNPLNALLACKVSDNGFEMAEGMGGGFSDITATNLAFAAIADLYKQQSMYSRFLFKIEEKPDSNKVINEEIESIKSYYKEISNYDYSTILGLNAAGVDVKNLEGKISLKNKDSIKLLSQDVISIIGVGKNPRNYNGKNYVKELINALKNSNDPKNKYMLSSSYFYGLLAISMASVDDEDINMVIEKIKNQYKIDKFKTINDAPLAIISLSPYKDKDGVKEIISSCIDYLKAQQLENGTFTLDEEEYKDGDGEHTALAIEALIAAGEDPLCEKWSKNGKTPLDGLLSFKVGNGYIYNSKFGTLDQDRYTGIALRALLSLKNEKTIFETLKIEYDPEKDKTNIIRELMNDLKEEYNFKENYDFSEALALNYSNDNNAENLRNISEKYKIIKDCKTVSDIAKNIMGITARENNPKNFDGKNYIEMLIKCQIKDGKNKGKFMLSKEDETNPSTQAYSIIALDMVNGKYDKESAINALVEMSKNVEYADISTTAIVITALSNHNNAENIDKVIKSSIKFIKNKQNDAGGFDENGQKNNLITTSIVIQALVANKIDIFSEEWTKSGNTMLDFIIKFKNSNGVENDLINKQVFMALADLYKGTSMFKTIRVVGSIDFDGILNELKNYYEVKDNKYNYIQALSLNKLGMDKNIIQSRLQLREDEPEYLNYDSPTTNHAKNIIAILSAGLDPKDYKGKNYVQELRNSQNDKGEFRLTKGEGFSAISQAYSIIALDMCKEGYYLESAVGILKKSLAEKGSYRLGRLAPAMIALSNHRDMQGVDIILNNCTSSLKNLQMDNGEFSQSGREDDEICSEDTAEAIQALVAVGEDVLSPKWQKNGKTSVDALMKYKVGDHFIYDRIKSGYEDYTDEATGMVFAALVDVYKGESMFKALNTSNPNTENPEKSKDFQIKQLTKATEFKLGEEAKITVEATNNSGADKKASVIIALYNDNNKIVDYLALKNVIKPGEKVELEGIMNLPKLGQYKVKAFVWDSLEEMNSLSEVIEIPVQ